MKRTSRALARLGTGGLAAAVVLTVAPFATGTAFAAPTSSSTNGNTAPVAASQLTTTSTTQGTVTLTPATAGQPISAAIAGTTTAYFPTVGQPAGVVINASGTTASCAVGPCTPNIDDTVSETVNLNVTETGTTPGTTTASVSFDGLFFSNCAQSGVNTNGAGGNCVTQGTTNTPLPLTVTLLEAGAGAANRILSITVPAGAAVTGTGISGGPAPTAYQCTTDANGKCTFNVVTPTAGAMDVGVSFAGDANYPAVTAGERVNVSSASVTPARLDLVSSTLIAPTPVAAGSPAEPGEVIQNVYQLFGACTPASSSVSCTGTALANQPVSLSVDHGFFTPNCTSGSGGTASTPGVPPTLANDNYSSCSFNATPAAGTKVGDIKSSGATTTATTDANGYFITSLGIAKDAAFNNEGYVLATVTATSGGATLTAQKPGNTNATSNAACSQGTIVGSNFTPATEYSQPTQGGGVNTAASGCPINNLWTTRAVPLNGGSAKFLIVPPVTAAHGTSNASANNLTATDSGTNNVPDVDRVVFMVNKTDQFGNLTNDAGAAAGTDTITKTGVGNLVLCGGYSSTDACTGGGSAGTGSTQPDGTTTQTAQAVPSYTDLSIQVRYEADAGSFGSGANSGTAGVNDGTQTDTLSWKAPSTTFTAYAAGTSTTGAFATYSAPGATASTALTDTLTFNFYNQLTNITVTLATTPSSTVNAGTAVTVTATVKDQYGNPVVSANYGGCGFFTGCVNVNFVRSGSNESSCLPTQTGNGNGLTPTDSNGNAGFTFSCSQGGTSTVTVAVVGPSNTQLAQGKTLVNFVGSAPRPTKKTIHATITCKSPRRHVLRCTVVETPRIAGLSVGFFRKTASGPVKIGSARTNSNGVAVLVKRHLKSHKVWKVFARIAGTGTTKPATTGTAKVTIK